MPKKKKKSAVKPRSNRHPLWALLLLLLAVFAAVALASYSPEDPSFNHVTRQPPQNLGGAMGAHLADLLLQTLGIGSVVLVAGLGIWAVRMAFGRSGKYWWMRVLLLQVSVLAACVLLMLAPIPDAWPFQSGLGGYLGTLLFTTVKPVIGVWWLGLLAGAVFLLSFGMAMALSAEEWAGVVVLGWQATSAVSQLMRKTLGLFRRMLSTSGEEAYAAVQGISKLRGNLGAGQGKDTPKPAAKAAGRKRSPALVEEDATSEPVRRQPIAVVTQGAEPAPVKPRKTGNSGQSSLKLDDASFEFPALQLLGVGNKKVRHRSLDEKALTQNARLLENVLRDFGVSGEIARIRPGPVVTLYELEPAAGTKSSRVIGLADDIARSMSAVSARIAVIPGRNAIGIELPNEVRETVYLRGLLEDVAYTGSDHKLPLALGRDIGGDAVVVDLSRMPHLLVAGTTGAGKSVAINTMILSLLYRLTPKQCKFIMIDPKMLELSIYDGIPHLLSPVVTEPGKAVVALKWTVKEMESRYRLMSNMGVRNIGNYNKRIEEAIKRGEKLNRTVQTGFDEETGEPVMEDVPMEMEKLPYIVVIVDEMADLMLVGGKDIEASVQRLAQMARAAGIHIIMATQRPSVDVITGVIKANFPTRISFQVTSRIDSRTILGEQGAEQLLGQGDMLYMAGGGRITRVHGPFATDKEVEEVVAYLRTQGDPEYVESVTHEDPNDDSLAGIPGFGGGGDDKEQDLYDQAVAVVARDRKVSTSYIQRRLKIGYNKAASLVERMEEEGVIGRANHAGKREILVQEAS